MGEMADYYVDRMIERHINPQQLSYGSGRVNYMEKYQAMSDEELTQTVRKAIRAKGVNSSFLQTAERILMSPPSLLSEKQRGCFLGLLNVKGDKTTHLQGLSDQELLALSEQAVSKQLYNPDFEKLAKKIVKEPPKALSTKQRNALLGFLNW